MWGFLFIKLHLYKEGIYFQLRANLCKQLHFEHSKCHERPKCHSGVSSDTPGAPFGTDRAQSWAGVAELLPARSQRWICIFWCVFPLAQHSGSGLCCP